MVNDIENIKKRLIYRSQYRGTKEMDKLVGSFVQENINMFDAEDLMNLEKFLNIDDDTLYKLYINQNSETRLSDNKIIKLFQNYKYEK